MYKEYRYRLETDAGEFEVNPRIEGESLAKLAEQQQGQVFYRFKLSSDLLFQRTDFDLIDAAPLDYTFTIHIDKKNSAGVYQNDWFVGTFTKTDCDFDIDENHIIVTPEPLDEYKAVMEGMEKEYNLIELGPETVKVNLAVQGLVQVYIRGANILTNILAGVYWEQDTLISTTNNTILENDYFFGPSNFFNVYCPGDGAGLSPDISGNYGMTNTRADGHYRLVNDDLGGGNFQWFVEDLFSPFGTVYNAPVNAPLHGTPLSAGQGALFTSLTDPGSTCRFFRGDFHLRVLTSLTDINGTPTTPIPVSDIIDPSEVYTHVLPIEHPECKGFDGNNSVGSPYGQFAENATNLSGQYFTRRESTELNYPLARTEWTEVSWWFEYDATLKALQEDSSKPYQIRHAYKIVDCVKKFLGVIDPTLTHTEDTNHSNFLYGTGNPIRGVRRYPIIVPKSNVITNEYDKPAQRANIRFADLLQFLADFYQVYWFIDAGKFRLEHIDYFDRGKSYSTNNVGVDLTGLYDPRSGKKWSAELNKYRYEKQEMPEQITHKWMDKSSEPFEGFPIGIRSLYVQKGNFQERNMALFTSDVDMIHVNPSDFSKDGFVFLECDIRGAEYDVPFVELATQALPPHQWTVQNGYATVVYAHDKYWKFNLPASLVTLNKNDITATSVKRSRTQEVTFPGVIDPDPMELITTELGTGKIKNLSFNLTTKEIKLTIHHDTE